MNSFLQNIIYILLASASLLACTRTMSHAEALEYISNPKNGYIQQYSSKKIQYKAIYKPISLVFAERQAEKKAESTENTLHYFQLQLSTHENKELNTLTTSEKQYEELLQTLQTNILNHVKLITNTGDTIQPVAGNYSNFYGHNKYSAILLAFSSEAIQNCKTLKLRINGIYPIDNSIVSLHFKTKEILTPFEIK